jgi:hypothetical protein
MQSIPPILLNTSATSSCCNGCILGYVYVSHWHYCIDVNPFLIASMAIPRNLYLSLWNPVCVK